jgi:hypothetical protein
MRTYADVCGRMLTNMLTHTHTHTGIVGCDNRMYILDLVRVTPRDPNFPADSPCFGAGALRSELVRKFAQLTQHAAAATTASSSSSSSSSAPVDTRNNDAQQVDNRNNDAQQASGAPTAAAAAGAHEDAAGAGAQDVAAGDIR